MKILIGILGQSNEQGPSGGGVSISSGAGSPVSDPIAPYGGPNSAWPHLASLAGKRGDWLTFRNHARGATNLCDSWVGRARDYVFGMLVVSGSYVIASGSIYKAVGVVGGVYVLNVAPNIGVGTSGLTSWTNLGAVTAEDVDGAVYSEDSPRFDPNGLLYNLLYDISKATGYEVKAIFVSIGQSDKTLSSTRLQYASAMQSVANLFTRRGIHVFLGFTNYGATDGLDAYFTNYLMPARLDALAALSGNPYVKAGADLRTALGILPVAPTVTTDGKLMGLQADLLHMNNQGMYYAAVAWDNVLSSTTYHLSAQSVGLSVSGTNFIKNGSVYKGYGVNHFSLFFEEIMNIGAGANYKIDIPAIKSLHIPFIRVPVAPYNAEDWATLWWSDKSGYLKTLDKIVKCAEDNDVGLIMSLSWGLIQIPKAMHTIYAVDETPKHLGELTSRSWQFYKEFVTTIVNRYKNSSSVYMWELGNEDVYSTGAEMGSSWAVDGTFAPWLNWGTKPGGGNYSASDKLSMPNWILFTERVVSLIKSLDNSGRTISSGSAEPVSFAVNAISSGSLTADTLSQRANYFGLPYNEYRESSMPIHCVHQYPQSLINGTSYSGNEQTGGGLITYNKTFADMVNKPLFIGEYGSAYLQSADGISTNLTTETNNFNDLLNSLITNNVQLSCLWTYDGAGTKPVIWMEFNVTEPDRVYQLNAIRDLNIALGH